ncbi:hypothetical protein MMC07_004918 [Pseudocyphellaria aurata]|nr:hypothetical protein [Pseudocyphellaria aurata]
MTTSHVNGEEEIGERKDVNKAVVEKVEESEHESDAERRVVRKMDWRIVTLLVVLCLFPPFRPLPLRLSTKLIYEHPDLLASLDRSNIGNARIAGMEKALELHGSDYQWLLTIFYIAYASFGILTICWGVIPPHIWITITVLGWGIVATVQSAVQSWQALMALRFMLGIFETGFGPGVVYLLSFFYLRHEVGLRLGVFLSANPLASTFAGALAYGITSGHSHLANWRLLFLVEGLPTILMAPVAFFVLPDSPDTARFLNENEKRIARARNFTYFSCNVGFSSLPVFLPTILEDMGFGSINAQGLTAPPFFLSFLVTIFSTYVADKYQQRGITVFVLSVIGGIGYVLLASCEIVGVRYFGVFLAAAGVIIRSPKKKELDGRAHLSQIFPCVANILPWVINNQGTDSGRGTGVVILNMIGQCGPFLGINIFDPRDAPRYTKGMSICAAFTFLIGILALALRALLARKNQKLDQKYGMHLTEANKHSEHPVEEETAMGDENYGPNFRYVL